MTSWTTILCCDASEHAALVWLRSYLTDKTHCVAVNSSSPEDAVLQYDVPQGSVFDPRKYCMYAKPVGSTVHRHGLNHHIFADDTQGYLIIESNANWNEVERQVQDCMGNIRCWMRDNFLKNNEDKFEHIIFHQTQRPLRPLDQPQAIQHHFHP